MLIERTHLNDPGFKEISKIIRDLDLKYSKSGRYDAIGIYELITEITLIMGLTSWVAFTQGKAAEKMIMGDLVLFQDEVNPVMSVAFGNAIQVTALHNHFFYDDPKVYFMHIYGEGTTEKLAMGVRKVFNKVKEIRATSSLIKQSFGGNPIPAKSSITGKSIEEILGSGDAKYGMYKVTIGLKTKMACGCDVGKDMGVYTWAAFAGTDNNAIVDGDFAVFEADLQSVLKTLRNANINIVAIHQHMIEETPRVLFLHYWGRGKATDLALALKLALNIQSGESLRVKQSKKISLIKKVKL